MKKHLIVLFFIVVGNIFAQDFFAPHLLKLQNNVLVPVNSAWSIAGGYDPATTYEMMDDFSAGQTTSNNVGLYGWTLTAGGAGNVEYRSEPDAIGVIRLNTDIGVAGTRIYLGASAFKLLKANANNMTIAIRLSTISTPSSDHEVRAGLGALDGSGTLTNAILFRAVNTGNWYAVTAAGGIETATDTGLPQSSSYRVYKIVSGGSQIFFYVDGVLKATHTTNIPTVQLTPIVEAYATLAGASAYTIGVDYFFVKVAGLAR